MDYLAGLIAEARQYFRELDWRWKVLFVLLPAVGTADYLLLLAGSGH